MIHLASLESLIGSIWFAGMLGLAGYIAGNLFPICKFMGKCKREGCTKD